MEARKGKFIIFQGELSVVKYEAEFVRLSWYKAEMVSQERDSCKKFHFGLYRDVQLYLVAHDTASFDKLVNKAKAIEELRAELHELK